MKNLKEKINYYIIIFLIGAFTGYLYEVTFYYLTLGFLNNWGVLYGPYLPIYGIGAVALSLLKPLKKHPIILFLSSILITGLVEYIIGYISITFFNSVLWDYTNLFLNINGLVCLRSVLTFSIGSMLLTYLIIPYLDTHYNYQKTKTTITIITIIFLLDIIISTIFRTPYQF